MDETIRTAEDLLGDLSGFRGLQRDASDLHEELRTWRQDQYDEWTRDMQAHIEDPNGQLR